MKLLLNGPVEHDGKTYAEGTVLDGLTDEQGAALVAAGIATEVIEDVKSKAKKAEA